MVSPQRGAQTGVGDRAAPGEQEFGEHGLDLGAGERYLRLRPARRDGAEQTELDRTDGFSNHVNVDAHTNDSPVPVAGERPEDTPKEWIPTTGTSYFCRQVVAPIRWTGAESIERNIPRCPARNGEPEPAFLYLRPAHEAGRKHSTAVGGVAVDPSRMNSPRC